MARPDKGAQKAATQESRKEQVSKLLSNIEQKLRGTDAKASLTDFIRLTQLERELEVEEQPREIIIRWVEEKEKDNIDG